MATCAAATSTSSLPPPPPTSAAAASLAVVVASSAASSPEPVTSDLRSCLTDDDFGSSDEVKVFKDEGDDEEKEFASQEELQAALSEDKSSLIQETELSIKQEALRLHDGQTVAPSSTGKAGPEDGSPGPGSPFSNGYHQLMSPYNSYGIPESGPPGTLVRSGSPSSSTSSSAAAFLYSGSSGGATSDPLGSPPPAHMGGIPYSLDPSKGLRPLYPLHPGTYPYSLLSPSEMSQFSPWTSSAFAAAAASSALIAATLASWRQRQQTILASSDFLFHSASPLSRCGPAGLLSPSSVSGSFSPHSLSTSGGACSVDVISGSPASSSVINNTITNTSTVSSRRTARDRDREDKRTSTHIKKPLNAFMLYMKEMRPKIVAECTLKESAAINQILGRRWHGLSREEQAKYYDQARKERQLHMQMYPGWSARDNYAQSKKKKRKREAESNSISDNGQQKKCRARYGLDQQDRWCKPCNRGGNTITSSSSSVTNHLDSTSAAAALGMMASSLSVSNGSGGPLMHHPGYSSLDDSGGLASHHITSAGCGGLGSLVGPHPPGSVGPSLDIEQSVLAPMHATNNNNNNNMISPLPISPIHCGGSTTTSAVVPADLLPHAALAAAASSMASIEAMGFMDQSSSAVAAAKLEKGTSNGESSPKYISL